MEAIEKIMEVIRTKLSGYRVETTTVQDVPEPVMLITNPKTGYACGYLFSNIQELLSQGLRPKEIAERFCDGILETEQTHIYLESQMESFEKVKDKLFSTGKPDHGKRSIATCRTYSVSGYGNCILCGASRS